MKKPVNRDYARRIDALKRHLSSLSNDGIASANAGSLAQSYALEAMHVASHLNAERSSRRM